MGRRQRNSWILLAIFVAAIAAGYWVSAVIGTEFLRLEVEKQVSGLLHGPVRIARVRLSFEDGLILEGEQFGVYPDEKAPHAPRLFSEFARAEIDMLALLTGHLRLTELLLRDATFDIRRAGEGKWEPFPVQALSDRRQKGLSPGLERNLNLFTAFEAVARALLSGPIAADHFSVENGRVIFRDEAFLEEGLRDAPNVLYLHKLEGRLVHHWLSGEAQLTLSGQLEGNTLGRTPVVARGIHDGAGSMQLDFEFSELPLEIVAPYLFDPADPIELSGFLSGEINYHTDSPQQGELGLHWTIRDFVLADETKNGPFQIVRKNSELHALLNLDTSAVELSEAELHSDGITTHWRAKIDRPIAFSALARAQADFVGLNLNEIRQLANSLPKQNAQTVRELLSSMEKGRIEEIGLAAEMNLGEWGRLFAGEMEQLPTHFIVEATLSKIDTLVNHESLLSGVGGRIVLSGDSLSVQKTSGLWNGEELPTLEFRIDGLSNLLRAIGRQDPVIGNENELAGFDPLLEILAGDPEASESNENHPLRIRLDHLEHPWLRWPLSDAILTLHTTSTASQLQVEEAIWAGTPVQGNLLWTTSPSNIIEIYLRADPPSETIPSSPEPAQASTSETPAQETLDEAWASGRFEIGRVEGLLLPIIDLAGNFRLEDSSLKLSDLEAGLEPRGRLRADLQVVLNEADRVPFACEISLEAADFDRAIEELGFARGTITGKLELKGDFEGDLRPKIPLFSQLSGSVNIKAGKGALRRDELPLLLALAQASAGYNEYAQRAEIAYDSMKANFTLEEGSIHTRNFELDGPLRIYASGTLDILNSPNELVGVVGLFLFRNAGELMASIPLVRTFLPGSERGLVGAYYQISGDLDRPKVAALAGKSVAEGLPDVLEAPYQILRAILSAGNVNEGRVTNSPKKKPPVAPAPAAPAPAEEVVPSSETGEKEADAGSAS